ncbi:aldo/keto reductase, putative [Talaromyces stipitatus ATCC 10500]|uniref:Aldo/keto reductase, putative n=1 Tax=Talaromyces stipitatus (strain ATCC 10500 / CBS 375.48 / QM 6759 / NRRL 1006) TaxID=441959 RepID=B8MG56_TALSN|nr:aldo/keto reductase, putative [Talaromyces stipitatus ATCC 10500]EED15923.1 aldo/keto reductase, putative [Talaromyces stipitatus ATCC 10500]
MPPTLFYGTAIFGTPTIPSLTEPEGVSKLLDSVHSLDITELDTAARYPPDNTGGSERLLGATRAGSNFTINTKVLISGTSGDGSLSKDAVRASVANSLRTLGVSNVGILYAHAPDNATPLEEQAKDFNEQYEKGYCERIGVSNFPLDMLEKFLKICDECNYIKPSVYQGEYNLIRRDPEEAIFPLLRRHKIHFVAYSPLGGGFLTGKLTAGNTEGTRFDGPLGQRFKALYDKPELHASINELKRITEPLGISPTAAALRWLAHHSELRQEDGIILGASKIEQLRQNVKDIKQGPLPESVVEAIRAIKVATTA